MRITDPRPFLEKIDVAFFKEHTDYGREMKLDPVLYVEPRLGKTESLETPSDTLSSSTNAVTESQGEGGVSREPIKSKIITLGDFIDTDAVSATSITI